MGVRALEEYDGGRVVLYCSTTDWAFGPVFESKAHAQSLLTWLRECPQPHTFHLGWNSGADPRNFLSCELEKAYSIWLSVTKPCTHCEVPFQPAEATNADQLCEDCYERQNEARRIME